jgi:hypothetical protein
MRLLVKHGANPLFVQHSNEVSESKGFKPKTEVTTALMAATGMGGGTAWVQPASGSREALTLEAVKLAVDLGVDVNAANTDGRTALDPARALKYKKCCRSSDGKRRRINRGAGARKVAKTTIRQILNSMS